MDRAEALQASDSADRETRITSIKFLGLYDDDFCRRAMVWLLTDEDVGVCEEAGRYLIRKNDVSSAELLFIGIAVSTEQQRFWTLWEMSNAWNAKKFDLVRIAEAATNSENFLARVGADDALKWMGLKA